MAKPRPQFVMSRDGQVLHSGEAPTLKAFIESLVTAKKSLARADLRARDLGGLCLDGAILDDALLDAADLRGASLRNCSAIGASFRGVSGHGMNAEYGQFQGADFGPGDKHPTRLNGARMAFGNFDGAIFNGAICDEAGFSRAYLTRVVAHRASFRGSRMLDTDFAFSNWVACTFDGAKMKTSTRIAKEHLPDRTMGASAISCSYKEVEGDSTTPAFARDRYWTSTLAAIAYVAASGAVVAASHGLHIEGAENPLVRLLHETTTFVAVAVGGVILTEWASEALRDKLKEGFENIDVAMRRAFDGLVRMGANAQQLVVATIKGPGHRAIRAALAETEREGPRRGFFSRFWSNEPTSVIFCDRRHLALALEALCSGRTRHRLNGDVILIRNDGIDPDVASLIRYRADGGTSLAWTQNGALIGTADYTRQGNLIRSSGGISPRSRINGEVSAFESRLLKEHKVNLQYDNKSHAIRAGRDGSIIVVQQGHRRPDNPDGPALLTPDGMRRNFRSGVEIQPQEADEGLEVDVTPLPAM